MVRNVLRKAEVMKATGWKNAALYDNIAKGNFPKSVRLVPDSSIVIWFEDEVAEWQKAAAAGKLDAWRSAREAVAA
jgi:prophage regulatory protein